MVVLAWIGRQLLVASMRNMRASLAELRSERRGPHGASGGRETGFPRRGPRPTGQGCHPPLWLCSGIACSHSVCCACEAARLQIPMLQQSCGDGLRQVVADADILPWTRAMALRVTLAGGACPREPGLSGRAC